MKRSSLIRKIVLVVVLINLVLYPASAAGNNVDNEINEIINNKEININNNFNKIIPINNKLLDNKEEKINLLITKYSPDYHNSSDCDVSQCWDGSGCVSDGSINEDNYCDNGTWTTRTKLLASRLLDLTEDRSVNYTLFCDDYVKSINYGVYGINVQQLGNTIKKFCVLTYYPGGNEQVVIGAVLDEPYDYNREALLLEIKGDPDYCFGDALVPTVDYVSCNDQDDVWYNANLYTVIFSRDDIAWAFPGPVAIQNLLQLILAILGVEPFEEFIDIKPLVENTSYFNKLFILQKGEKTIFAVLEEGKYKDQTEEYDYLVINYYNFYSDICLSVNQYSNEEAYTKCDKIGLSDFVINRKTPPQPKTKAVDAWPQLTAQIRAKDVPDIWPPKILRVWAEPQRQIQGVNSFSIFAEISDPLGVNAANITIWNESGETAKIDLTDISCSESNKRLCTWGTISPWTSSQDDLGIYYVDIYTEDTSLNGITKRNATSFQIIIRPVCMIESSCTLPATEIFSLSSISDAHVAESETYFNLAKMCCLFSPAIFDLRPSCGSDLSFGFSISGTSPNNDQHIGNRDVFVNYEACLGPGSGFTNCLLAPDCGSSEECVLTISGVKPSGVKPGDPIEGHVTACNILYPGADEFPNKLCCARP